MADPLEAMGTWLGSRDWGATGQAVGQFANRALGGPAMLWAEENAPKDAPSVPEGPSPFGPLPQSMEPTGGGLGALAGGYQQPSLPAAPVNPYAAQLAGMTPAQLQAASVSSSGSGSTSRLGGKPLPGLQQAYDRLAMQQQSAAKAAGEAQSAGALERAGAMRVSQAAQEHRQIAFEADIAKERARAEQYDAQAAKMRAEVSEMKVDPENYWSSRTTGEKFGIALGVALSQFGMILAKQQGTNPVLQMFERAIDRDIDAQKSNIQKKRGDLADVKGALGDIYRKMGDMRSAENQTKILMMESLKSKLDVIGATTQSEVYKAAALQQGAVVGERLLQLKNQAWTVERARITSGGSTSTPSQLAAVGMASKIWEAGQKSRSTPADKTWARKDKIDPVAGLDANDKEIELLRAQEAYRAKHPLLKGAARAIASKAFDLTGGLVGVEAAGVDAIKNRLIAAQVKAASGAAPSDMERKVMVGVFPGPGANLKQSVVMLGRLAQERIDGYKNWLQVNPESPYAPKVNGALMATQLHLKKMQAAAALSGESE